MEKNKVKKVSIDDVEIGMTLSDVIDPRGRLLFSGNVDINNWDKIRSLKRLGIESLYIITQPDGTVIPESPIKRTYNLEQERQYYTELKRAKEIHIKTIMAARDVLSSVRMGKRFDSKTVEHIAENIVESILRNPDALVSLSQIKGYDEYTYVHSVNVGILMTSLANSMGFDKDMLLSLGIGGLLHDVGKMRVPEHILNKMGTYTPEEFAVMKKHPVHGLNLLKDSKGIPDIAKLIVSQHHERFNGKGYPTGLIGEQIPEVALIAAVADVYDAMTTDRIYRAAWLPQKALAMIFRGSDVEYSRRIVELFTKHLGIYPVGSFIRLANGEMGVVVRVDKGAILAPDVVVLYSKEGKPYRRPVEYKLMEKQSGDDGDKFRIEASLNPKDYQVDISKYVQIDVLE